MSGSLRRKDGSESKLQRLKSRSASQLANLNGNNSLDSSPSASGSSTPSRRPSTKDRSASRTATLLSSVTTFLSPNNGSRSNSSSSASDNDVSYTSARSSIDNLSRPRSRQQSVAFPAHHLPNNAGFKNPWPSAQPPGWQDFVSPSFPLMIAKHPDPETQPTKTVDPDWSKYADRKKSDNIVATWLGHAGALIQLPFDPSDHPSSSAPNEHRRPIRLLFDPIFSLRAGPSQWTGPKRFIPSPCQASDLPEIDFCFISHSHYDHLDLGTILDLHKSQPHIRYFVPLALKPWFSTLPIPGPQVVELDWWEDVFIPGSVLSLSAMEVEGEEGKRKEVEIRRVEDGKEELRITFVPAQHKSGRTALDQDTTLWGGWIVEQFCPAPCPAPAPGLSLSTRRIRKSCVYHAGDTGYRSSHDPEVTCPIFREIGDKFGPIDFSMIPIWRGGSLSFLAWAGLKLTHAHMLHATHVGPEDALRLHQDVKSRHTLGVHHGCFVGSEAESVEPLVMLREAIEEEGEGASGAEGKKVGDKVEEEGGFGCTDCGQTIVIEAKEKEA